MNYNSVILVGTVAVSVIWWLVHATRHYPGPRVMQLYIHDDSFPSEATEILQESQEKETLSNNEIRST